MAITNSDQRSIGLLGATGIGIAAIVGGGILALAGVAFATAGPAAIVAFALNGVIALLTVLSFAEMATAFPESGGTYTCCATIILSGRRQLTWPVECYFRHASFLLRKEVNLPGKHITQRQEVLYAYSDESGPPIPK